MLVKTSGSEVLVYPYNLGMLRRDNPQTSFPKDISEELMNKYGIFKVQKTEKPVVDRTKEIVEGPPQIVDGKWVQSWVQEDLTQDEIDRNERNQAAEVRKQRNQFLNETDFHALSDVALSDDMATYRQALRDIPQQAGFPNDIEWPEEPSTE